MTLLKKILVGLGAVVAVLAVVVAMQPEDFTITRSMSMNAPAAKVFEQVNDFSKWVNWSPWEKMDPNMKKTFEGPTGGEGAVYSWAGNDDVGEGRMTLVKAQAPTLIEIKLEFLKPMTATNTTGFTFQDQGGTTLVTWTMSGKNNFMAKAFHLCMDIDKMVGADFEKGLAQMKAIVEGAH